MTDPPSRPGRDPSRLVAEPDRTDRLKAALKANMARRKAQARARTAEEKDEPQRPARGPEQD
ncbi:MAG TPA: hypothetical protein PKD10_17280 [Paracoccaceae bacterium]|nr:hypothetical protein [Paracoccaceae bacterium]HMO73559.1 hypothetical protein [Paracoccaceae bacterium]